MSLNTEYLHSLKTNSYRRRSKSLSDKADNDKNSLTHNKRYHSPPPRHAHHQPVMKFNADMWMQDFKQNVMKKLFKEERFKAFQKKRRELDDVMDVSDDEEWQEQQKLIQSVVQNEWDNYQNWLREQQFLAAAQQYQQSLYDAQQLQLQREQQEFIDKLPAEIARAVTEKNLPSEWFQYRENAEK